MNDHDRNQKRPSWNAALIGGHATMGGETSGKLFFLYTVGFAFVTGGLYVAARVLLT